MSVKDTRNYSLHDRLKELNGARVRVGIVGESDSKLLTYAAVNEYGANIKITPKMRNFLHWIGIHVKNETTHIIIPERSYIRATFDNKKVFDKLKKKIQPLLKSVLNGGNEASDILDFIGLQLTSDVKQTIANMKEPVNHPVTIKRKGEGKGLLVDSGRLTNAISYEVV
jgi:phage gpG-like protein